MSGSNSPELAIAGPANLGDVLDFRFAAGNCHFQILRYNDSDRCLSLLERPFGFLLRCSSALCVPPDHSATSGGCCYRN